MAMMNSFGQGMDANAEAALANAEAELMMRQALLPPYLPGGLPPPKDPMMFGESCLAKLPLNAAVGAAMGGVMGLFLGSYNIAPAIVPPGVPPPPKRNFRQEVGTS